jgi:hypothetical protein
MVTMTMITECSEAYLVIESTMNMLEKLMKGFVG